MIKYEADVEGISVMVSALKSVDPKLVTLLRRELKSTATSVSSLISGSITRQGAPLSGMIKPNVTIKRKEGEWGGAVAKVKTSFAGNRRRDITPLIYIEMLSPQGKPGYSIVEAAGHRNPFGLTPQGAHFIAMINERRGVLKGKGGNRIAWRFFVQHKKTLNRAALQIIDKYSVRLSEELNK
jgi:hypothetical protein